MVTRRESKRFLGRLLLVFVLVSIGYALGKEAGRRSVPRHDPAPQPHVQTDAGVPAAEADRLVVYYFHATIRCVTCNTIERIAHETLESEFAAQLADGSIQWRLENFHENEPLAERYGVATSTVVLVRLQGEREVDFRRLDRVWELVHQPAAFAEYIAQEVRDLTREGPG
jgi:hypothetical protein